MDESEVSQNPEIDLDIDITESAYVGEFAGKVSSLSAGEANIEIYSTQEGSGECSVGTGLVVDCGDLSLFVRVVSISGSGTVFTATARFVCTLDLFNGNIFNGVANTPFIGADAFYATHELIDAVSNSTGRVGSLATAADNIQKVEFEIAQIKGSGGINLKISPETLYGRHACVVGSTGSGKSWTIAKIIEETARYNSKSILIDATGEYKDLDCDVVNIYFGDDPEPHEESREVVMPFFDLYENDLFGIFSPRGESQGPKLKAAIESLKMVSLVPSLGLDGIIIKAHKSKMHYMESLKRHSSILHSNNLVFDIKNLPRQIENECVQNSRSAMEPMVWGDFNAAEQSNCIPLISRVNTILNSKHMDPIFSPENKLSVFDAIDWFLKQPQLRVLRISMEYLSHSNNVREIVSNAIARKLLLKARAYEFKNSPLVLFMDEAHQFVDVDIEYYGGGYKLDSVDLIAKEARKYGLSLCLATQRPKDMPESIFSQVGTMIVHRLTNHNDRAIIERACTKVDPVTLDTIPVLGKGEAIMFASDYVDPVHIIVNPPRCAPRSENADFQTHWS